MGLGSGGGRKKRWLARQGKIDEEGFFFKKVAKYYGRRSINWLGFAALAGIDSGWLPGA